jgi:hypothetical protein
VGTTSGTVRRSTSGPSGTGATSTANKAGKTKLLWGLWRGPCKLGQPQSEIIEGEVSWKNFVGNRENNVSKKRQ